MFTGLSLDQAPPFRAPLKFFLTAPIFAILAGIFALFSNNYELHSPNFIASVHLITLGYMVMLVFGALQQMLPVVAGAVIPRAKLTADITYILLTLGVVFFTLGFVVYEKIFFFISASLLLFGLLFFTVTALVQLLKVQNRSYIVKGMSISLIFFIGAFLLAIHLLISHATGNISQLHYSFATLHYNYIFFGFIFLLIVSITIQVVPMFWVAESYKQKDQRYIIYLTSAILALFPINLFLELGLTLLYKTALSSMALYFVYITIKKLKNRKRKLKDITVYFYNTSMIFLSFGVVYWLLMSFIDIPSGTLGVLLGLGFTVSLMNGMLYKIVPFLTWFHLNSKGVLDIPTMREMIPQNKMQTQYYIHTTSVIVFAFGFLLSQTIIIKGAVLLFILSNILFFINIYSTAKIYFKKEIK
ncbi:MAG: hypothetical protein U9Q04_02345 [Campylobacterota bacterium]|nr:hypothetical protein [Campylobacterota bacterium]